MPDAFNQALEYLRGLDDLEQRKAFARLRMKVAEGAENLPEPEPPIMTMGQFLDTPLEEPPQLVKPGVLVRGTVSASVAMSGAGKTHLNLGRAIRWAVGDVMFEDLPELMVPVKPLRVLVVENEGAPSAFRIDLTNILNGTGYADDVLKLARENVMIWGDGGFSTFKLDVDADVELIRRGIEKHEPDVVILDPFAGLWSGEENDATAMKVVLNTITSEIAGAYNIGVMLIHHERKGGAGDDDIMRAARGSTALEGHVAYFERFEKHKKADRRELKCGKWRHGHEYPPILMKWNKRTRFYDYIPVPDQELQVLERFECWGEPGTASGVGDETGMGRDRAHKLLDNLVDRGKMERNRAKGGHEYRRICDDENGVKF